MYFQRLRKKKVAVLFLSVFGFLLLFTACDKIESGSFHPMRRYDLEYTFMSSIMKREPTRTVLYLYYPRNHEDASYNNQLSIPADALLEKMESSSIQIIGWSCVGETQTSIPVTEKLFYCPLEVTYTVPGNTEEQKMVIGFYEVIPLSMYHPDASALPPYAEGGRILLDWEDVPPYLKEQAQQPKEDNGKTIIDLLSQ